MLTLRTEDELAALHTGVVKESLHIEYKASDSIDKRDDKKKLEIARDVSAFANADGGQIVYGMKENKDHEPDGLDAGVDPKEYPEIWFEQILQQHVTPLLTSVKPRHVPLQNGRVAVVIDIPATDGDPHQVDGRYYRRHNFNRLIMEHYEVRDAFRRLTAPNLWVSLSFVGGERLTIDFPDRGDVSNPFYLIANIENRANTPAHYTIVEIGVAAELHVFHRGTFDRLDQADDDRGTPMNWFRQSIIAPPGLPIFKGHKVGLTNDHLMFALHHKDMGNHTLFDVTVKIATPGFTDVKHWTILARGPRLQLYPPGSPYSEPR